MKKFNLNKLKQIIDSLKEVFLTRIGKKPSLEPKLAIPDVFGEFDGSALLEYTGEGYEQMNDLLWGIKPPFYNSVFQTVKDIVEITESMQTRDISDNVVYRGTQLDLYPDLRNIQVGMKLPLKGLTSTSLDRTTAEFFSDNAKNDRTPLIFKIHIDSNTPFIRPDFNSPIYHIEKEVLLPPAIYEVVGVTPSKGADNPTEVELRMKELIDIRDLLIDGLDYILDNDPLETHHIEPHRVMEIKDKVDFFYTQKSKMGFYEFVKCKSSNTLEP